jgi:zeta-carotene desaturase
MDPYRPDQTTPVPNFFLAGSYTKQVRAGLGVLLHTCRCCCTFCDARPVDLACANKQHVAVG